MTKPRPEPACPTKQWDYKSDLVEALKMSVSSVLWQGQQIPDVHHYEDSKVEHKHDLTLHRKVLSTCISINSSTDQGGYETWTEAPD